MGASEGQFQEMQKAKSFDRPFRNIRADQRDYTFLDFTNQGVAQKQATENAAALGGFNTGMEAGITAFDAANTAGLTNMNTATGAALSGLGSATTAALNRIDAGTTAAASGMSAATTSAINRLGAAEAAALGDTRSGLDAFAASTQQSAAQQAMRNTRGVGEAFGAMGAIGSGAAAEAYAQGALTPYFQAQQSIAQMENQAGMQRAGIRQQIAGSQAGMETQAGQFISGLTAQQALSGAQISAEQAGLGTQLGVNQAGLGAQLTGQQAANRLNAIGQAGQFGAQLRTQQAADFADRFSAIAAPTIDIGLSEMERRQATGAPMGAGSA